MVWNTGPDLVLDSKSPRCEPWTIGAVSSNCLWKGDFMEVMMKLDEAITREVTYLALPVWVPCLKTQTGHRVGPGLQHSDRMILVLLR